MSGPSLSDPHHDGSELYVPEPAVALGDEAVVRLRVPRSVRPTEVGLRYVRDGQPYGVVAEVDEETEVEVWWSARVPMRGPRVAYRWVLAGGDVGYVWVNGAGGTSHDVPDSDDFVLALAPGGPDWHVASVVYEIFPDRFASTGRNGTRPEWAVPRAWTDLPTGRGPKTTRELFGGDLPGIEAHLDHVASLGANVVYLTPVFPAGSSHRYDATTFERIDPLLGGDEALESLVRAAHARGIRVVGDLTLHHTGDDHEWFRAALADDEAPERDFFIFDPRALHGYEAWLDVRTLPKLDHRSTELRRRLTGGPESVVERWLREPVSLDGWRIDVANMTGRYGGVDLNLEVARDVRHAVEEARPDGLLVAEHGHDYREDLLGDGWHGAMNYAGFLRPVWSWLRAGTLPEDMELHPWGDVPVSLPCLSGADAVATMRAFRAGIPWASTLHSWVLLDSHDTARFRTVTGIRERQLVGLGLQMTAPGVPMVFAGDELGLEGAWGEDARRPMPWDRPDTWDRDLLCAYRRLIELRRSSRALAVGGIRYAHVDDDAIVYLRETSGERVLCLARRAPGPPIRLSAAQLGRELEPVASEGQAGEALVDADVVTLPGEGPGFLAWRIE